MWTGEKNEKWAYTRVSETIEKGSNYFEISDNALSRAFPQDQT